MDSDLLARRKKHLHLLLDEIAAAQEILSCDFDDDDLYIKAMHQTCMMVLHHYLAGADYLYKFDSAKTREARKKHKQRCQDLIASTCAWSKEMAELDADVVNGIENPTSHEIWYKQAVLHDILTAAINSMRTLAEILELNQ